MIVTWMGPNKTFFKDLKLHNSRVFMERCSATGASSAASPWNSVTFLFISGRSRFSQNPLRCFHFVPHSRDRYSLALCAGKPQQIYCQWSLFVKVLNNIAFLSWWAAGRSRSVTSWVNGSYRNDQPKGFIDMLGIYLPYTLFTFGCCGSSSESKVATRSALQRILGRLSRSLERFFFFRKQIHKSSHFLNFILQLTSMLLIAVIDIFYSQWHKFVFCFFLHFIILLLQATT